jgi:ubiquinone/menaquinone biosynthesis C-methylase UbiE
MTTYVLTQEGAEQLERSRLALVEELHDPLTRRQLEGIGVGPGWRCLDVGAGAGSVAWMLAELVGSSGHVMATDLDTRLLEQLRCQTIKVVRHDLLSDPLPEAGFDLVHARLLLMHLPARLAALRRLAAAVRPGGWLAIIDTDFTPAEVWPASPAWSRVWAAFCDGVVAGGWDLRYGRRLCEDLRTLGMVEVEVEQVGWWQPGGALAPRLLSLTIERLRDRMRTLGADDEDIDEARRILEDPATTVRTPLTSIARARRPQETWPRQRTNGASAMS